MSFLVIGIRNMADHLAWLRVGRGTTFFKYRVLMRLQNAE